MGSARLGLTSDSADQVFLQNGDQCRSRDAFSGQSSKPLSGWFSPGAQESCFLINFRRLEEAFSLLTDNPFNHA